MFWNLVFICGVILDIHQCHFGAIYQASAMLIIKSSNGPFPLTFLYIIHVIPAAKVSMQKTYDHTIFWSFFLLYTFIQNINHVIFLHSNYELPANSNNCKHANTHARQRRDLAGFFETNHNFVQNYYDLWGYKCYANFRDDYCYWFFISSWQKKKKNTNVNQVTYKL